jgi:uncharacterized membrane protein
MIKHILLAIIIIVLDIIWLSLNKDNYNKTVRSIQGSAIKVKYLPAVLSYLLVLYSIIFIAIPAARSYIASLKKNKGNKITQSILASLIYGGGLGLVIYGIFNTTNMAIFDKYDAAIAVRDTLWGVFLYTVSTFIYIHLLASSI